MLDLDVKVNDKYYIAFDYVVDNQDIRNKYCVLKSIEEKSDGKIIILDMICYEYPDYQPHNQMQYNIYHLL